MAINVKVEKNSNENTASLVRRFTKRVQGSGVLPRMRKHRYYQRSLSPFLSKEKKLTSLKRKATREELIKLGKISGERPKRKGFRRG